MTDLLCTANMTLPAPPEGWAYTGEYRPAYEGETFQYCAFGRWALATSRGETLEWHFIVRKA
jgi:hypothetical protein